MRSPLERREDVASLGSGEFRESRAVHISLDVSTVFHYYESPTTDALRQVRSTGKREDSLCLFLCSLRVNLQTRGRAGTLSRVLSGFIASSSRALDCYHLSAALSSWSSKFFERDRGVYNFPPSSCVLIGQVFFFHSRGIL